MSNWTSKILIILTLITFTLYSDCQSFPTFIQKIKSYQNQVKVIRQENPEGFTTDSATFNLATYFGLFDKLEVAPNRNLEYVFCYYSTYGIPSLYVKHDSVNIENHIEQKLDRFYKTFGTHKSEIKEEVNDFRRYELLCSFARDSMNKACNNIIPADSKTGYLQYLYFYLFGENFALFWHSNYWKGNVIFSKNEMQRLYDIYMTNEDYTVTDDEYKILKGLLKKRFKPKIKKTKDMYHYTWYEHYLHRGIFKSTYQINRHPPFIITRIHDEEIVSPQYGIMY
jgi:hypothetical protein